MKTIFLCGSSAGFGDRYSIHPSSEGREGKVAASDKDCGKLVMSASFGVCRAEGGQDAGKSRNLPEAGVCMAENASTQPDLKGGKRTLCVLFWLCFRNSTEGAMDLRI